MVTPELISFVKDQRIQGLSDESIKAAMLAKGWNETDIEAALLRVDVAPNTPKLKGFFYHAPQPQVSAAGPTASSTTFLASQPEDIKPDSIFDFRKLKWYEIVATLPVFILLVNGGLLGAAIGLLGWPLCMKVIRAQSFSMVVKIISVLLINLSYFVIYFFAAGFLVEIISRLL
jgi:hypothetical protein